MLVALFVILASFTCTFIISKLTKPKVDGSAALQQKILEDLAAQLKEFQKIPALLTNPAGLKTIGEKNLEFLLGNVLPKDFVLIQHEMPGVGIVDTAIRVGDRVLPIDSKFPKWNEDRKALCSAVKDRIKEAGKYVSPKHGTTDFVLMFVPAESIYHRVFVEDVDILSYAIEHKVVPVSPATIYAYLLTLMDSVKRIEFAKGEKNVLASIKQSISIFEASKVASDKTSKQLRDALTNAEIASKKIQDALDVLKNLTAGSK